MVVQNYNCTIVIEGSDARIEGTFPVEVVVDATSYFFPGYKFTTRFKNGRWDGRVKLFSKVTRTFPAGLAQTVLEALREVHVQVQLDDRRYCPNVPVSFPQSLPGASFDYPYDYQPLCAWEMARRQRGVIGIATNGGKSACAALFIAATKIPTLFMVPNLTLLYQTQKAMAKYLDLKLDDVGLIGDNHWEPKPWITVATANTLYARLSTPVCMDFLKAQQLLIVDECFVAGTRIDGKPIEEIKVGDLVRSYNEEIGQIENCPVEKIHISKPKMLVRVQVNGITLTCTPGHPFWTQRGWVLALALLSSDMVLYTTQTQKGGNYANSEMQFLWNGRRTNKNQKQRSLLSNLSSKEMGFTKKDSSCSMHRMRKRSDCAGLSTIEPAKKRSCLLQHRLQNKMDIAEIFRNSKKYQSKAIKSTVGKNEIKQPNVTPRSKSQTESYSQSYGMETSNSGRKWQKFTSPAITSCQHFGMGNGSSNSYRSWWTRIPYLLQSGHWRENSENSNRGRWRFSLCPRETNSRSEKRRVSSWYRVESVEILKQTSDGTFGGLCPKGVVYNLQVKKNHTYFAENIVVHNCHRQSSNSWYLVSRSCSAFWRFGLSGTPMRRSDGADLRLIGVTGPVIYEVKNKELIRRKISVQPIVHFLKITKPLLSKTMPYREVHKLGIVENPYRNNDICLAVSEFVEQGLNVLITVDEIKHGEILDKRLWTFKQKLFIPHQFVNGSEIMEIRNKALADFERGDLRVLIATNIFSEGLNLPNIDVLALAGGGKAAITLLQRIGRGLRTGGNTEYLHIIDTADFQHRYLLLHSLQRMQEYKDQDCFEIEVAT